MRTLASALRGLSVVALGLASISLTRQAHAEDVAIGRAEAAISRGDYALAEKEYASVTSGPDRAKAALGVAQVDLTTGRYAEAIAAAKSAAGLGRDARNEAAVVHAQALAAQGKTDEAIAACKDVAGDTSARRARLYLGELLVQSGKIAEARKQLVPFAEDYKNDAIKETDALGLAMAAHAAQLADTYSLSSVNDIFKEALAAGANKLVDPLLWHAELFASIDDYAHAGASLRDALKVAPKDPRLRVIMARLKLDSGMDFEAAESEVRQALEVNPSLSAAFAIRAGLALRDLDIAGADRAADKGLSSNPNDLELLSMKAAIRLLADDRPGFESFKKRVFGLNPVYSKFYRTVAEFAEWEHRYDDIAQMMRDAVHVNVGDAKAYGALGLNLVRLGDEKGGRAALDRAWELDNHDVRVSNMEKRFFPRIDAAYETVRGPRFNIRYSKADKPILERYVPAMLEEAWASMVKRYGFTPKMPVEIELYADDEIFSVRVAGLPHVGIQGVCFGQTLAAMSPSAGEFNWGNVLWHELGHVFALQLSKNHVPRWFTEGLSEYETIVRRPEWQREEDPGLYAALNGGRIPRVDDFNRAFTHVKDVSDVTMAYYAASQIQVFLAQEFGFPKIVAMLPKWAAGERTPEVVKETLGITSDELDRRFHAWLMPRLDRYAKQFVPDNHVPPLDDARKAVQKEPKNAKRYVELARALFDDRQGTEGEAMLDEALRLDPKQGDAEFDRLRAALHKHDMAESVRLINKMIADGHDGYSVRMRAADLAEAQKDVPREKLNLEAAYRFDPSQDEPLQGLYDLAHKKNDDAGELWALQRLAMLDQHDRKVWGLLLTKLVEHGAWEEARKIGEGAMFVDVQNPKVHRLYARALARTGRFVSAVYELNSALVCKPKLKDQVEIYGDLAAAYDKLGKPDWAKEARTYQQQIAKSPVMRDADDDADPGPKKRGRPAPKPAEPEGT